MSRKVSFVIFISLLAAVSAFAQYDQLDMKIPVFKSVTYYALEITSEDDYAIPQTIANNRYYLESVRLNGLAVEFFDVGEYDVSAGFAEEAYRYALLSDEYVAGQLLNENERLIDWASGKNAAAWFPHEYNESLAYYQDSLSALTFEEWKRSISFSTHSIEILSSLVIPDGLPPSASTPGASQTTGGTSASYQGGLAPLPSQYTVRTWAVERDCLWTIAGYPWVYNDPRRWPELYEANKTRMPQPDNPDLIHPGFILNIPSNRGEARSGMWDPNLNYGF